MRQSVFPYNFLFMKRKSFLSQIQISKLLSAQISYISYYLKRKKFLQFLCVLVEIFQISHKKRLEMKKIPNIDLQKLYSGIIHQELLTKIIPEGIHLKIWWSAWTKLMLNQGGSKKLLSSLVFRTC